MSNNTKLEKMYKVLERTITLTIIIGDAQLGSSLVLLEGQELGRGEIKNMEIGRGADIVGKILKVKSIVTDVNDNTNRMSIIYQLRGGQDDKSYSLEDIVSEDGDSTIFRAKVEFNA